MPRTVSPVARVHHPQVVVNRAPGIVYSISALVLAEEASATVIAPRLCRSPPVALHSRGIPRPAVSKACPTMSLPTSRNQCAFVTVLCRMQSLARSQ